MIIAKPSSLISVALNILTVEDFFQSGYDYLPILISKNSTVSQSAPLHLDDVKTTVPFLNFSNELQKSKLQKAASVANFDYGFVSNLKVEPINIHKELDTFDYANFTSTIDSYAIKTNLNIAMNILLPFDNLFNDPSGIILSPTSASKFQEKIYRLSLFPFVPAFFLTDLTLNNLGQPVFLEKFDISVNDNSPVTINMTYVGATKTYADNTFLQKHQNNTTYRVSKIYDCFLALNLPDQSNTKLSTDLYANSVYYLISGQNIFIEGMSLSISNGIELQFTASDGINKKVKNGAQFISMKKRKVSGKITFLATQDMSSLFYNNNKNGKNINLTMFFGGTFYYPMSNVLLQQFDVELQGDTATYKHTVSFIALTKPSDIKEYYKRNEFDVDFSLLQKPFDGKLKIPSQKNTTTK